MNKNFRSQFMYGYSPKVVELRAKVSIGATGAPTVAANTGMAISSITRLATGKYQIALSQAAAALLDVSVAINSGASAPAAPAMNIVSEAVNSSTAPAVVIQMRDISGAAADPASGEVLHICVKLHDSSLGY